MSQANVINPVRPSTPTWGPCAKEPTTPRGYPTDNSMDLTYLELPAHLGTSKEPFTEDGNNLENEPPNSNII
ncbi:hypothetical protein FQN51_002839, partial [Onygenales sp. PD_10]